MSNKENVKSSSSKDENLRKKRETIVKAKSKSLNPSEKFSEDESNEENEEEVIRAGADKKSRQKSQKVKMKIKRQVSLEEQFSVGEVNKEEVEKIDKEATSSSDAVELPKVQEKKYLLLDELKVPKIEVIRKNGMGESFKSLKDFSLISPNSSKLRERFSKSKFLKQDSKNLSVELSKSSDSGIGVSRSTEDESLRASESVIFRFFDIGPDTRLNKSDSEKSPNFLDTVSLFTRSRSHERSVSSDSSDKNLSDLDKPSIKIRKRHEYSESRDSSSSYEGNIFDTHISNRVRKLHEVALKQMQEENSKNQKLDVQKRFVDFKYPVEFGSYDDIQAKPPALSKVRKFKSLERTDSSVRSGESFENDEQSQSTENQEKSKNRLKKQERLDKRLSLKDKRYSFGRDSGWSGGRKEKRCRTFLKSKKDAEDYESDENVNAGDSQENSSKGKDDASKRLSRKDKKVSKTKRALSEEHRESRKERSLLFSITSGKRRSDSEIMQGRREISNKELNMESDVSKTTNNTSPLNFRMRSELQNWSHKNLHLSGFHEIEKSSWRLPDKIFSMPKYRNDFYSPKLEADRNRVDFMEIGSYLELVGKIWPASDDYKIVFISSDSSAKENRSTSTDSESVSAESCESGTDTSRKLASDYDWDYFESSTVVRPMIKDWNWQSSSRSFGGTLFERASPIFSNSDDNSPKFPRRNFDRFSIKDSSFSCETDISLLSPNLKQNVMGIDATNLQNVNNSSHAVTSTDNIYDDSQTEERAIEVSELKASPPFKCKELFKIQENAKRPGTNEESLEARHTEEVKKSKKRKKSRKAKKNSKDEDIVDGVEDPKGNFSDNYDNGNPSKITSNGNTVEEVVPESLERDVSDPDIVKINNLSPDGCVSTNHTLIVESVVETTPDSPVVQNSKCFANREIEPNNIKIKSKKQKNKKKCGKCGKTESAGNVILNEFVGADEEVKTGGDLIADEFTFRTGRFGYQTPNLLSYQSQYPDLFRYNFPLSNILQNIGVFQNFIPVPVPVLIPVPFPVPTAIWSQNYQNNLYSNFSLASSDILNRLNLQNIYESSCPNQNYGSSNRFDRKMSFKANENNPDETGNEAIQMRPVNMQRPAFVLNSLPCSSQGSVNSNDSHPTCLTVSEQQLLDNDSVCPVWKVESIESAVDKCLVPMSESMPDKKTKKSKRKSKGVKCKVENPEKEMDEPIKVFENQDGVDEFNRRGKEEPDLRLTNMFIEGKTFDEMKNGLKHKGDFTREGLLSLYDSLSGSVNEIKEKNCRNIVVVDETIASEVMDNSLVIADKNSECTSTSNSDDSDSSGSSKPFRKSYYFNLGDSERRTSDDSDIADLGSSENESKTENSSHCNSTASEDEGNPDSRFSEVYIVNPSEPEIDVSKSDESMSKHFKENSDSGYSKKYKRAKNFPLTDDLDVADGSNVILLKHVKKLSEDFIETPKNIKSETEVAREPESKVCTTNASKTVKEEPENNKSDDNADVHRDLHNSKESGEPFGAQAEDPVTLVTHLAEFESGCASVVSQSEIIPESVPEILQDSNSSGPVLSEIFSVRSGFIDENKFVDSSSPGHNSDDTRRKLSENKTVINNNDFLSSVYGGDVNYYAESLFNNGDSLKKSTISSSCNGPVDVKRVNEVFTNDICDVNKSETNQNDSLLLDKIENKINHFSQLDNPNIPPHQGRENKYTSLIMITQDKSNKSKVENNLENSDFVKVITNNTTLVLPNVNHSKDDVQLNHLNRKNESEGVSNLKLKTLEDYYTMTLENSRGLTISPKKPNVIKNMTPLKEEDELDMDSKEEVQVVTDDKTLSAVICLEEGLADDDSWVEDLEKDRESDFITAITEEDTSSGEETGIGTCTPVQMDREEELRGYHRGAISFTLHTIVEESCEESEVEDKSKTAANKKQRPTSATDLEKYFYFDIGGGFTPNFENQDLDTFSESSSSIYSESGVIDDAGVEVRENSDQTQLSTSRLEKYFLNFDRDGREKESDGSVGSDSEGPPSPEQRRKRLFRARASNRLHSNSLDNLVQSENEQQSVDLILDSEHSSTETDVADQQIVDKSDDSVKRKKKRKISGGSSSLPAGVDGGDKKNAEGDVKESRESLTKEHRHREIKEDNKEIQEINGKVGLDYGSDEDRSKTPQPDFCLESGMSRDKQQSRDSGFIGSCDDLLKDQKTGGDSSGSDTKKKNNENSEKVVKDIKEQHDNSNVTVNRQSTGIIGSTPPATSLTRKDSFNNWSSDEETNLMMSKMRQFFKAMVSVPKTSSKLPENSNPSSPQVKNKGVKSPQLVYFENELTRLMKTVPGIRDDQVREIVEYLSSEDTWSDSYDSSDYTSSDLEGTAAYYQRSQLQREISESCKQIIDNFDQSNNDPVQKPKVPPRRNSSPMNRETAFVYQKLVASFNKITNENDDHSVAPNNSPPLFAKVMHHIGSRLVALMHEVSSNSSGEGSISSHKARYHKRISQKLSNVSSTTEEDCGFTDESDCRGEEASKKINPNLTYFQFLHQLPRSKSHDLLLEEAKVKSLRSSSSGVSDIAEEKEASDYERFSWRGSFESALMADSRSKLTLLSNDSHSSSTTLVAKRRSAGDLLFLKSLSREQLDRVRSCGSIGGVALEDKNIWTTGRDPNGRRRSSVPDAASPGSGASADGDEDSSDSEVMQERSITLPRGLQCMASSQNTNSLPRLPTTNASANAQNLSKAQSVQHFLPNAKSARYRPPGFNRIVANSPKRTVSAPGLQVLQPSHNRRERRRNQNFLNRNPSLSGDELNTLETTTPLHVHGGSKSASPSPIVGSAKSRLRRGPSSVGSPDWSATDEIQRLVNLDQQRHSNSSLGARSDSMASVYSGAGEGRSCSIPVRGEVEFGLQYNYKAGDLEIYVKQCKDLAAVDSKRNRSDPYVKVYLLPDKSKSGKRKTKVKKHTLNPVFDEVLKFHISLSGLETRTLWLTVWHSDMFGRNDFLGEVMISLENKVFDDPTPKLYTLQERTEPFEDVATYKGEIIIGLKFIPPDVSTFHKKGKRSKGTLNVKVKEAKNLTAVKTNGVSDPFCKSYLLPDKGKNSKQKTPVQRRTCNPSWNHTFVYEDVSLQELSERCLELTVWDHDRLASNEFLGGLRFSLGSGKHYGKPAEWMDSAGKEITLWQSMLEKPNLWVEGCLPLRASLDRPNTAS